MCATIAAMFAECDERVCLLFVLLFVYVCILPPKLLNRCCYYTDDGEVHVFGDFDILMRSVFGSEYDALAVAHKALNSELVEYTGNDDLSGLGRNCTIDNQRITVVDTYVLHGVANDIYKEGGVGITHKKVHDVHRYGIVAGRDGRPGTHTALHQWKASTASSREVQ